MEICRQGKYCGYPSIVVEFAQEAAPENILTEFQIWKKIKGSFNYQLNFCFITLKGCDPSNFFMPPLMNLLCDFSSYQLHLETNGQNPQTVIDAKECNPYIILNVDTPLNAKLKDSILHCHEIRLPYGKNIDPNEFFTFVRNSIKTIMKPIIFLQPDSGKEKECEEYILKHAQFKMIMR